jgi:1,4-dihydroxy-2-naphthoate octaprenyltransferase
MASPAADSPKGSTDAPPGPPTGFTWLVATARLPFLTASLVPVLVGTFVAWAQGWDFNILNFVLTLAGMALMHIGANISNDYYDYLSGTDNVNEERVPPFTGGSRMIQMGVNSPQATRNYALLSYALAALIGVILSFRVGPLIIVIGAFGLFCGWFYTAPPIRLSATGFGELFLWLNFGVVPVLGSYLTQTGTLNPANANFLEALLASIPVACFITMVLWINQFPDASADEAAGKHHLVVRLGKRRAVWGYIVLVVVAYADVVASAILGYMALGALVMLLSLPTAIRAASILRKSYDDSVALAPALGMTIQVQFIGGLLLSLGYLLAHFIPVLG